MKNIFYFRYINKIGGIETWFYQLAKKYKNWDITIYYKDGDEAQLKRLKQYVSCVKYTGQHIVCEKAFFNFNLDIIDNVEAEEYNMVLHGDYKAMVEKGQLALGNLPRHEKITHYYGVSQLVCDSFEELTGIKPILAYNPFEVDTPKRVLNLISATRLTKEKGKNRIEKLGKMLDAANIPYVWTIYTDDWQAIKNENIIYRTPRLDIIDYIANADILVQLSDNEGYCYSVVEALSVGTPVLVTDMPVMKEIGVENGVNGWIVDFDLHDVPLDDIYKKRLKFEYTPKKDTWDKIMVPGKSEYMEKMHTIYTVAALDKYRLNRIKDAELGYVPQEGETWDVSYLRLQVLLENDLVEVIKKRKEKTDDDKD